MTAAGVRPDVPAPDTRAGHRMLRMLHPVVVRLAVFFSVQLALPVWSHAEPVVVVNAVRGSERRHAAMRHVSALRAALVARGLARQLPEPLSEVVEGARTTPYRPDLTAMRAAYADFDYAAAHALLRQATAASLVEADAARLPSIIAELLLWHGVVAVAEKDDEVALRYFRAARQLAPERRLERARFAPRVRRLYRLADAGNAPDEAELVLNAPAGARIRLDGRGIAPDLRVVRVPAGIHLVSAHKIGRLPWARLVELEPRQQHVLRVALAPEPPRAMLSRVLSKRPGGTGVAVRELSSALSVRQLLLVEACGAAEPAALCARLCDGRINRCHSPLAIDGEDALAAIAALVKGQRLARVETGLGAAELVDDPLRPLPGPRDGRDDARHWYESPWVWAAVGVVVAGGTAAYALSREPHLQGIEAP